MTAPSEKMRLGYKLPDIRPDALRPVVFEIHKVFDVAFRSPDRGIIESENAEAGAFRKCRDAPDHLYMRFRLPYDAFLSDLLAAGLELRLDECDRLPVLRKELVKDRQDLGQ